MGNRTRLFLMGSATVVLVGLGVGLLTYIGEPTVAADDAVDDLAYVPADATLVAYADVRAIMNSELRQRVKSLMPSQRRGQDRFREETGIDLETDVERVVAAVVPAEGATVDGAPGVGGERRARGRSVAVVTGRFDTARLEGAARQRGASVEDYKGVRLIRASTGESGVAVAFAKPGTVLVGDEASVKRAIDDRASRRGLPSQAAMMGRVAEASAGSTVWAVGRADSIMSRAAVGLPKGLSEQLPALEWFTASGHFNGGVSGTVRTEARDDAAAKNLRDVIQGVVALGRLQVGQHPEVTALFNSLQLGGDGRTVTVSFMVSAELLERLSSPRGVAPAP